VTWPASHVSSIFGRKGKPESFAMMFCSLCGEKCATAAIFCHKCGKMISLSVDKENGSPSGVHCVQETSATASKSLLTFAAFRSRKEDDRSKYCKPSVAKRLKREPERVEKEVKVQVGIVTIKDGMVAQHYHSKICKFLRRKE